MQSFFIFLIGKKNLQVSISIVEGQSQTRVGKEF